MHESFSLRFQDRILLGAAALFVCVPALLIDHSVGMREAAYAQSLHEMSATGRWLTPTVGGQSWLTAAPVTQWFAHAIESAFGISSTLLAIRLAGVLPAILATLWTATFAASCFGRRSGLLSGFILLTTLGVAGNIWHGGIAIWLVAAGCGFMNLLAELENRTHRQRHASAELIGSDSLRAASASRVLCVFVLLGLATMLAGLVASVATIIIPASGHVILRRQNRIRFSSPWYFGCLLAAMIAAAWPVMTSLFARGAAGSWLDAAFLNTRDRQPLAQIGELIQMSMPWLPLIILGQWSLRHDAFAGGYSRERLLACWSLSVPVAVFLLTPSSMVFALAAGGAWSVSAAVGVERLTTRIFHELPTLKSRHNRAVLQYFLAGSAAVLTLSIVWNDLNGDSRNIDREVLAQARTLADEGYRLKVDMNLGDQAAVLLVELGERAIPLQQFDMAGSDASTIVISSAESGSTELAHGTVTRLFESSRQQRLAILKVQPRNASSTTRIATAPAVSRF